MQRDDDIVRALGFVALYSAYVEESVDLVMHRLSSVKEVTNEERKWSTTRKIKWCIKAIESLDSIELTDLISLLKETKDALEKRHEALHGRIYPGNERNEILESSRPGVAPREVTAGELYALAEELFSLQASIPHFYIFATMRAIAKNSVS